MTQSADKDILFFTIDWKNRTETNKLIFSLAGLDFDLHIIVNDNLPINYSLPENAKLSLVTHQIGYNSGFAAACNTAINLASSLGKSYIVHFNNDISFTDKSSVFALFDNFKTAKVFAIASPTILQTNGKVEFAGAHWLSYISPALILSKQNISKNLYSGTIETRFMSGACFIARVDAILSVGGFDEEYFCYREEHDLCFRLINNGYKIGYIPSSTFTHNLSASSSRIPYVKEFLVTRGQILYLRKNLKGLTALLYGLILTFKTFTKIIITILKGNIVTYQAAKDAMLNQFFKRKIIITFANEHITF